MRRNSIKIVEHQCQRQKIISRPFLLCRTNSMIWVTRIFGAHHSSQHLIGCPSGHLKSATLIFINAVLAQSEFVSGKTSISGMWNWQLSISRNAPRIDKVNKISEMIRFHVKLQIYTVCQCVHYIFHKNINLDV